MFKGIIALLINICLLTGVTYAEETFTISGELTFQYEDDIYVCLFTEEAYKDIREKNPPAPYVVFIKMDAELKKAGKATFEFSNIPKGTYCIIAYQESIKNGKFDFNPWAGTTEEPWGCYKPMSDIASTPQWTPTKFDLDGNLTGVEIQM